MTHPHPELDDEPADCNHHEVEDDCQSNERVSWEAL